MTRKTRERSATRAGSGRSQTGQETTSSKTADQKSGSVALTPEKLKRLYSTMLKCRMIEERACALAKKGAITRGDCFAIGKEATEVGAAIDLLPEDCAVSGRDFITSFIKGTPLRLIFSRLHGQTEAAQRNAAPARNG